MTVELTEARSASFSTVFSRALRGHPCLVVGLGADPEPLPVSDWTREADAADHELLTHCEGPTLDIGCGPGRLAARLVELGHVVLGIDVVHEAVRQTRERGVAAIVRDVFDTLPGEGRWRSVLLADGNVGIGGDPVALLRRARELLEPRGRVVVELARPGHGHHTAWAELHCGDARSRPFRWSLVGTDAIEALAAEAGLRVASLHAFGGGFGGSLSRRWCAVLEVPS
jgi:SAM-dependent methyltransferase